MWNKKNRRRIPNELAGDARADTRLYVDRFEELALAYAEAYLGRAELERLLSRSRAASGARDDEERRGGGLP